ncbi:carbohydrate ABC transporter permease [Paenibacillus radicis (ex Gao et al. 2016)]|uniref:ABC transporter permease n=1 Tax=Paenibacillus radicis (ex Gao et al. 2016) TaxID=1737354 RepID=A0A917GQP8_9BACL|nr:sugar ABC transporter permease [Paenibacillus radicis (ex Gao et al. 2016)]GGG54585.1 ABC transporter permease [Paenibacillus radicis (ex Gao et al. 2016)]
MNTELTPSLAKPGRKSSVRLKLKRFLLDIKRDSFAYFFLAPFLICFLLFIVIPVVMAATLGFTSYDGFGKLHFIGVDNYIALFTQDIIFLTKAIPNTFLFALIVGPGGYLLSFAFAWLIHQLPMKIRDYYTLAFYAPSMAGGVALTVVWIAAFSGDRVGYFNNFLLGMGWIDSPVIWLQDPKYLLKIMIVVSLWTSFSVGFLAMLAGLQTVNRELYEAGRIDGITSRLQEVFYITIPSMKPQMLFSAVMSIVGTLKAGGISTQLTGMPITPSYSGHLIINHIDDYAFIRFELGYASAVSVMLLIFSYFAMRFATRLFGSKEEL